MLSHLRNDARGIKKSRITKRVHEMVDFIAINYLRRTKDSFSLKEAEDRGYIVNYITYRIQLLILSVVQKVGKLRT